MSNRNVPTDADFARARAAMQHRDRGLSEVRSTILNRFASKGLHEIFILYSPDNDLFVSYLFFKNEDEQVAAEKSGLTSQLKAAVLDELERVGRGEKSALKVSFEIDNDAKVQNDFDGDYFARLG